MKKLKGLIFGMAVALPLFFGIVRPVHADNGTERLANHMQVSPASQQLGTLKPGEIKQGSFRVQNIGTNAFDFKVYAVPYSVSNENYDPTFDASSDYTKISNWFTFNTTSGHLDSNSEATIEYTVKVPQNAPGGGQYASIMVENTSSENSSNTIREVTRIGMLIYSHIDGKINHCTKILENSLPFILFNPPISPLVSKTVVTPTRMSSMFSVSSHSSLRKRFILTKKTLLTAPLSLILSASARKLGKNLQVSVSSGSSKTLPLVAPTILLVSS